MSAAAKPLIIAEKPSAARAIAEALGGFSQREGYLESSAYRLSWAIGHLVELMAPEEYNPKWKRWSLESLPMVPDHFDLKVTAATRSQFGLLAKLAVAASELINACDAAREGELIFRYICEAARVVKPVRRLWVSALTREAIRAGFADLKPQTEYDRLYWSARCRAQGDWLVGMNATRAFTTRWGELLSVGRVQTPTLALLVRREREVAAFKPETYWEVLAEFATSDGRKYKGKFFGPGGDRLPAAEQAEAVARRVRGAAGLVESVETKETVERPPQLFDLTTLQREANRRFGLTAATTLKAAQGLYEQKLTTYPRTDSRYLPKALVKELPAVLHGAAAQAEFRQAAAGADLKLIHPGNRRVVDDSKVTDHHAIIPTAERPPSLSGSEAKIYGLIMRRFLAQFYPEARYEELEVITASGPQPDRFRSRGRTLLQAGWRVVEPEPPKAKGDEGDDAPGALPALRQGEGVKTRSAEVLEKQTQPPKRYTEASLLQAMETAGRQFDDEALREAMKGRGLGTPATRAAIIERLKEVGYVAVEKKALAPTSKGHRLVELAEAAGAQVLLSAELTGEWEKRIGDIQAGAYDRDRFMFEIRQLTGQVVDAVRGTPGAEAQALDSAPPNTAFDLPAQAGRCPLCKRVVIRQGRDWKCANDDCTVRIPTWLCGKKIDQAAAGALLTKGRTALIADFTSPRTGKVFAAYLKLVGGKVEFEFPPDKPRKVSGYRRNSSGGPANERTAAAKTGSPAAGGRKQAGSRGRTAGGAGGGMGRRSSRASERAGAGPQPD